MPGCSRCWSGGWMMGLSLVGEGLSSYLFFARIDS